MYKANTAQPRIPNFSAPIETLTTNQNYKDQHSVVHIIAFIAKIVALMNSKPKVILRANPSI